MMINHQMHMVILAPVGMIVMSLQVLMVAVVAIMMMILMRQHNAVHVRNLMIEEMTIIVTTQKLILIN